MDGTKQRRKMMAEAETFVSYPKGENRWETHSNNAEPQYYHKALPFLRASVHFPTGICSPAQIMLPPAGNMEEVNTKVSLNTRPPRGET